MFPSAQPKLYPAFEKRKNKDDGNSESEEDAACYGSCPGRGEKYTQSTCTPHNQCRQ